MIQRNLNTILVLIALFGITGLFLFCYPVFKVLGDYEVYCIEWEGFINRDMMVVNCYDFVNQEIRCDWSINPNNQQLTVLNYTINGEVQGNRPDLIGVYNCSRYVKIYDFEKLKGGQN